jgi:CMP-N-acetylneuraminic acid synthetase
MKSCKVLITICARGGSKGIPGKNIKLLDGKPLIQYTIQIAQKFQSQFDNVSIVLSSDSDEIINTAADCGLIAEYRRPDYLAKDSTGKIEAIRDVLFWMEETESSKYDYLLDLDVTSPLRTLGDLSEAFYQIQDDHAANNLFSVSIANRNPYFNMVEIGDDGYYHLIKKFSHNIVSRQSAPKVFELNASFYFYRREFFDIGFNSAITERSLVYVVPHMCFDLDHPIDFEFLTFLIRNNKIDFDWL